MPTKKDLREFQNTAEKLALGAGKILLKFQDRAKVVKRKADFLDIATEADIASEKFISDGLHKNFSGHNIFAEERGDESRQSDFTWVIDPLDGTKKYIKGLPDYNIAIALEYKGELIVGIVYRPRTGELFSAAKGLGVYQNGKRMSVSGEVNLKKSILWMHLPGYRNSQKEIKGALEILERSIQIFNKVHEAWEDSSVLAWLSTGKLEAYFLTFESPKWWDVAPGILMVTEGGGKITNAFGQPIKDRDLTHGIVASNGKIHDQLLEIVK